MELAIRVQILNEAAVCISCSCPWEGGVANPTHLADYNPW